MHERDLNNRDNDNAVVEIHSPVEDQAVRTHRFRSRVTRDGTRSLEIETPRGGATSDHRCGLYVFLVISFFFLLFGIVPSVNAMVNNDAIPLGFLISTIGSVFVILLGLCITKILAFTQTNVKIIRGNYFLIQKSITWKSFFQILFIPSHFDDFESGQFVETGPKEYKYARLASLQAEIVTHRDDDNNSEWNSIKLGFISLSCGLVDEELEWLVEQINLFLRETS